MNMKESALDKKERLDSAYRNLDRVIGWVGNADTKATVLLAFHGAIIAGIGASAGIFLKPLFVPHPHLAFSWQTCLIVGWLLCVVCAIASIGNAFWAINPILTSNPRTRKEVATSLFFFEGIAHRTLTEFISEMKVLDFARFEEEILKQTHANVLIISRKFRHIKRSTRYLLWEVMLLVVIVVLMGIWKLWFS